MAQTLNDFKNARKAASKLFPSNASITGGPASGISNRVSSPKQAARNVEGLFPDSLGQGPAPIKPLPFPLSSTKNLGEQQVEVVTATGGTRTLTFGGQTTSALAYDANAAAIKAALEALSNVGTNDILVDQAITSPFTYRFGGAYAGVDAPAISVKTHFLDGETSTFQSVTAGANEVQRETITATGGTRTLTFSGQTTTALAYNASASTIQTALEALSNIAPGDVAVTGSGTGPFTYTFGGVYAGIDVPMISVGVGSLTGGSSTLAPITTGAEDFQVETLNATSGTRTLTFSGQTTAPIAFNATAAQIQTALEALSNVAPGDITVEGTFVNRYIFSGVFANLDVASITVNAGSLTGGTATIVQDGTSISETIKRQHTQAALAAAGFLRNQSQVTNDVERFGLRKPIDIGQAGRIAGEDFGIR